MNGSDLVFQPVLPWLLVAGLAGLALAALGVGLWFGLRGIWWRTAGLALLLAALCGPSLRFESREPLKDIVLVGHSMGGLIALKIALRKKISLNGLILCAPAGFEIYTPHESVLFKSAITMGNFLNLDETQMSHSVRSSFYHQNEITEKIIADLTKIIHQNNRSHYRSMLEQSIHSMLDEQIFRELKNITTKTLVFFGEEDGMIPNKFLHPVSTKEIATKATQQMPNATLILYRNIGHFVHIENAAEVNETIIQFLNKS